MARQAIRGVDGRLKFSTSIPVRIGRAEIIDALTFFLPHLEDPLPVTRTDAKRLAKDFLAKFGAVGPTEQDRSFVVDSRQEMIVFRVDDLFSELREEE